jgi:hypothetical protein
MLPERPDAAVPENPLRAPAFTRAGRDATPRRESGRGQRGRRADVASAALAHGAVEAFEELGLDDVPRQWLQVVGSRPAV